METSTLIRKCVALSAGGIPWEHDDKSNGRGLGSLDALLKDRIEYLRSYYKGNRSRAYYDEDYETASRMNIGLGFAQALEELRGFRFGQLGDKIEHIRRWSGSVGRLAEHLDAMGEGRIISDPTDCSTVGGIGMRLICEASIMHNTYSTPTIGYLGIDAESNQCKTIISYAAMGTNAHVIEDAVSRFVNFTAPPTVPAPVTQMFTETGTERRSALNATGARILASEKAAESFKADIKELLKNGTEGYLMAKNQIAEIYNHMRLVLTSMAHGSWSTWNRDSTKPMGIDKFDQRSFKYLENVLSVPANNRVQVTAFSGTPREVANTLDDYVSIVSHYKAYHDYVIIAQPLSDATREEMKTAINSMYSMLIQYPQNILRVFAEVVEFKINPVTGAAEEPKAKMLPLSLDEFKQWVDFTTAQLIATSAEGITAMRDKIIPGGQRLQSKYGFEDANQDIVREYVNPFKLYIEYHFSTGTFGKSNAETRKNCFIMMSTKETDDGLCLIHALLDREPRPQESELVELRKVKYLPGMAGLIGYVKSIPLLVIKSVKSDGTWKVVTANRAELYHKKPAEIDLTKTCVICEYGKHAFRVTEIKLGSANNYERQKCTMLDYYAIVKPGTAPTKRFYSVITHKAIRTQFNNDVLSELAGVNNVASCISKLLNPQFRDKIYAKYGAPVSVPKEECWRYGLPYLLFIDLTSEWKVINGTIQGVTKEDVIKYPERFIVIAKHKGEYVLVIDYDIPMKDPFGQYHVYYKDRFIVKKYYQERSFYEAIGVEKVSDLEGSWCVLSGTTFTNQELTYTIKEASPDIKSRVGYRPDLEKENIFITDDTLPYGIVLKETSMWFRSSKKELPPLITVFDYETLNKSGVNPHVHNGIIQAHGIVDNTYPVILHAGFHEDEDLVSIVKKYEKRVTRVKVRDKIYIDFWFEGELINEEYIRLLADIMAAIPGRKVYVYGFNSATFDIYELIPALAKSRAIPIGAKNKRTEMVKAGNKILELRYENLYIRDIRRFANMSLAGAAKAFGCEAAKIGFDHLLVQKHADECGGVPERLLERMKTLTASEFLTDKDEKAHPIESNAYKAYHAYCLNDCKVTLELVTTVNKAYEDMTNKQMNVYSCLTVNQAVYKKFEQDLAVRKMKLHKCLTLDEYTFLRRATQAGTSRVFPTAPRGYAEISMLMVDETSQYPHKMHQGWFVPKCEPRWVTEIDHNNIGFYEVVITKRPTTDVIPLKAIHKAAGIKPAKITGPDGKQHTVKPQNTLGSHFWEYEGEHTEVISYHDYVAHKMLGGECRVIRGIVYPLKSRGLFTEAIEMFKKVKQAEDAKPAAERNMGRRQGSKDTSNGGSGKLIQAPNLTKVQVMADPTDRMEYITKQEEKYGAKNVSVHILTGAQPGTLREQLSPITVACAVMTELPLSSVFETKAGIKSQKSLVNGLLVYAQSRYHMMMACIDRINKAKAAFAIETDSIQFDREKYEAWMDKNMPGQNPYDIHAPDYTGTEFENSEILRMPMTGIPDIDQHLKDKPFGYFYCGAAAKDWANRHGIEYVQNEDDYGCYKPETGLTSKGPDRFKMVYLGKKSYYLDKGEDGKPKMKFKGVGKSSKDASELVEFLARYNFNETLCMNLPEYKALLDKIDHAEGVISDHTNPVTGKPFGFDLYKRLSDGYGIDVCEKRFRGELDFIEGQSAPLNCSRIIKRLSPPGYFHLMVRTLDNTPDEMQYPTSKPHGKLPLKPGEVVMSKRCPEQQNQAFVTFDGQKLTRMQLCFVYLALDKALTGGVADFSAKVANGSITTQDMALYVKLLTEAQAKDRVAYRGCTIPFKPKAGAAPVNMYVGCDTIRYLLKYRNYFTTKFI